MIALRYIRALLAVVVLFACIVMFSTLLIPAFYPTGIVTDNATYLEDAHSCKCKLKKLKGGPQIAQQLDLELPWLNVTTSEHLARHHPNLPVDFLYKTSKKRCCSLLPSPVSIAWVNLYWQEAWLNNTSILLYSATYDPNPGGQPCVRLLGVTRNTNPPVGWCHLWFNPQEPPVAAKVTNIDFLDYQSKRSDRQLPFLFTCPLPPQVAHLQPSAVSLVPQPCQPATTLLQVGGAKERETSAYQNGQKPADPSRTGKGWVPAVCGPALYYYHHDFSKRLVEWLEILRAEGFGRVFLYTANVHPNIEKVLNYYVDDGFIQLTRYSYPPPYINEPSIQRLWTLVERKKMFSQENIYFTDCLLRHMHQYRFIAHYDPDEVPILLKHDNYTQFLDYLRINTQNKKPKEKRKKPVAYSLQWNIFYNDLEPQGEAAELPEYLWVLRHTRRTVQNLGVTPGKFKALYDMDTVRGVFSHEVIVCTTGKCSRLSMQSVPPDVAYLGHFTRECGKSCEVANSTEEEPFLHKYRKPVSEVVTTVLKKLQLIYQDKYVLKKLPDPNES